MRIFFSVGIELEPNADELSYVPEDAVRTDFNQYLTWIEQYEHGHELGKLTIFLDNQDQIEIKDELYHLVSHVCLRSIPVLLSGQKYIYHYMDFPSYIHIHPHRDHLEISGDYITALTVRQDQLLHQLYTCGIRYINYLQLLGANQYQGYLEYLQIYVESASKALYRERGEKFCNQTWK